MQLAFTFPDGFPLDGVDREIFAHQVREVFCDSNQIRLSNLDRLRKQIGRAPLYAHQRDVLETLLSMTRTSHETKHRDALIAKTAEYLGIGIAEIPNTTDKAQIDVDTPRHGGIWARFKNLIIGTLIGIVLIAALLIFWPTRPDAHVSAASSEHSEPHAVALPTLDSADAASTDTTTANTSAPVVDVSIDTRHPAWVLATLAKLAPVAPGTYTVELKVTPVQAGLAQAETGR